MKALDRWIFSTLPIVALVLWPSSTAGQWIAPEGDKIQINEGTAQAQNWVRKVSAARLPTRQFIVVWDENGADGSDYGVRGRILGADGNLVGSDFQVNQSTQFDELSPDLAVNDAGEGLVVWTAPQSSFPSFVGPIFGRRFDSSGQLLNDEFQVTDESDRQDFPAVTQSRDGGFVVAWTGTAEFQYRGGYESILARKLSREVLPEGPELVVDQYPLFSYRNLSKVAATQPTGDFVVVWQRDYFNDANLPTQISRVILDSNGNIKQPSTRVDAGSRYLRSPDLAVYESGQFLVGFSAWTIPPPWPPEPSESLGIYVRPYNELGQATAGEIQINSQTTADHSGLKLLPLLGGKYLAMWSASKPTGETAQVRRDLRLRLLDSQGTPEGSEIAFNETHLPSLFPASLVANGPGEVVAFWTERTEENQVSVYAQRLTLQMSIFSDGFESGDLSAWFSQ